jgi:hypothetical protein
MPQVSSIARDDGTKCDVIPAGLRARRYNKMMTSHIYAVSAFAIIPHILTAARQLQIYTGFPFNSQDRNKDATFRNI